MEDVPSIVLQELDSVNHDLMPESKRLSEIGNRISSRLSGIVYRGKKVMIVASGYSISVEPDKRKTGKCIVTVRERDNENG